MNPTDYINFDLQIERAGDRFRARAKSLAGEVVSEFSLPFTDLEFENFLLRIGRPRRSTRRADSPETEVVKNFGGNLFTALFHGDMLGCLRSSLASRQGSGLRLRLLLTETPELADVPWEYLYDRSLNQFLALSVETPLVRYLELPAPVRPLVVKPPLRVLVMISSPTNFPRLDVESEMKTLRESLGDLEQAGLVVLTRLDKATLTVLQSRLQREEFHIFHFIGHGGFDQAAQDGVLILEDEAGVGRPTSGQELGTFLHDHRPMRLAVLNACEGARSDRFDPFAGVAQSLVQQGVPAVIAMQFEITDEAAITFAQQFYGAVSASYPIDAALAESRKAIYAGGYAAEWGTPVLYLRSPDGCIFDVQKIPVGPPKGDEPAQTVTLSGEADTAFAREDWALAIVKLQALLSAGPADVTAQAKLKEAVLQQQLAALYAQGSELCAANRWREALVAFRKVQELGGAYKDVAALIANAKSNLGFPFFGYQPNWSFIILLVLWTIASDVLGVSPHWMLVAGSMIFLVWILSVAIRRHWR